MHLLLQGDAQLLFITTPRNSDRTAAYYGTEHSYSILRQTLLEIQGLHKPSSSVEDQKRMAPSILDTPLDYGGITELCHHENRVAVASMHDRSIQTH
jgi:hypothetical protein